METGLPKKFKDVASKGDSLPSILIDEPPVPDIGSTIVISSNQIELSSESPSRVWTGKRVLCSFSSNSNDLDEYPFHAVTYGEPGELRGLPYNDHNYAKIQEDEGNTENQLTLLAKLALAKHDDNTVIELSGVNSPKSFVTQENSVDEQKTATGILAPSQCGPAPPMKIFKPPFVNQFATQALPSPQTASSCKVTSTNGRTILLTPPRGSLGASVQIHRVASINAPNVIVRTDMSSTSDMNSVNGVQGAVGNSIRCICGFTRDDGCLVQCINCKILQHAGCMAPSSNNILPKPYFCELCQPRPVMVSEAVGFQQRKIATVNKVRLPSKTIRLANNPGAYRLPRTHTPIPSTSPLITPNRLFLAGNGAAPGTTATLAVRPIQVRLGDVGSSAMSATLYHVDSATLNHFSPRIINFEASAGRQLTQSPFVNAVGGTQRTSKRKQDLLTLAGEPTTHFNNMANSYTYDETSVNNEQRVLSAPNDHIITSTNESNDLPGPKFYRTPSQAPITVSGLSSTEGAKPQVVPIASSFGDVTAEASAAATDLTSCVPEPASPDVVIWSDSYERATETRLSDALKQRIRNIFLTPSERELRTLKMADSSALSRGQQRCRVANPELGRKGLIATENIYPNQPVIEYKGYAMLMDEYSQQHDYRRYYNPFVLFYKQLDKAVICLDASEYGNEARFIRRSCMPNSEVRLTFPPTDSFSSVVNPQCIQFVITSAVNRVLPVGTELTVAFDFDYTACSYPVRCACARGPPLCAVADWFRRHKSHLNRHRKDSFGGPEDIDRGLSSRIPSQIDEEPFDGDDENEGPDSRYMRPLAPRRVELHTNGLEKSARNRITLRRLLAPKRVSPAFSRVPYPSAKHMVQQQQQHRRHQLNQSPLGEGLAKVTRVIAPRKRGGRGGGGRRRGTRVSLGRGSISTNVGGNILRRSSRPRGRPPNSGVKRQLQRPPHPLTAQSPPSLLNDNDDEDVFYSSPHYSTSPRTDVTEPGAASPWFYGIRSPPQQSQRRGSSGKRSVGKSQQRRKSEELLTSPSSTVSGRRRRRRSSVDTLSPVQNEADEMGTLTDDPIEFRRKESGQTPSSKIRSRKLSVGTRNGFDENHSSTLNDALMPSSAKRNRRQSDVESVPLCEQGDGFEAKPYRHKDQASPVRSNKSREENWLAEVLRRIERMEKNDRKPKKPKRDKYNLVSEMDSNYVSNADDNDEKQGDQKNEENMKESDPQTPFSKKNRRRSTPSGTMDSVSDGSVVPATTPALSREDRWMRMQLQRIAEMESGDVDVDATSLPRHRRRASSGAKSSSSPTLVLPCSSPKKDDNPTGEEECNLIVYKRRDPDPMAKFSRSRTARGPSHHHHAVTRTFSLVETAMDADNLPAGGELLDDHPIGASTSTTTSFGESILLTGPSQSPPKPSKKRWLSQALLEEDQQRQHAYRGSPPSPVSSPTPLSDHHLGVVVPSVSQHQRAINPKKRIISQIEEALIAQQQQETKDRYNADSPVSPSDRAPTTSSSKLPPKKRQTDDGLCNSDASLLETGHMSKLPPKPEQTALQQKQEKVRMSLSEYRRRRGMSIPSTESQIKTAVQPQYALPCSTPPADSPLVDLKHLLPPLIPPPPPSSLPTTFSSGVAGGPRTPSEPPSDEDCPEVTNGHGRHADGVDGKGASPPPSGYVSASNRLDLSAAVNGVNSPTKVESFQLKSNSFDVFEKRQLSPDPAISPYSDHHNHCNPAAQSGYDRHLSGHAHRRASPPPPPSLKTTNSPSTTSPNSLLPILSESILRRDQEIRQMQIERQNRQQATTNVVSRSHNNVAPDTSPHHSVLRNSASCISGAGPVASSMPARYDQRRSSSSPTPQLQPLTSQQPQIQRTNISPSPLRSHLPPHQTAVLQSPTPTVNTTTAFNHPDIDSIQESLRVKNEHLRALLRDLRKATAGGGG